MKKPSYAKGYRTLNGIPENTLEEEMEEAEREHMKAMLEYGLDWINENEGKTNEYQARTAVCQPGSGSDAVA